MQIWHFLKLYFFCFINNLLLFCIHNGFLVPVLCPKHFAWLVSVFEPVSLCYTLNCKFVSTAPTFFVENTWEIVCVLECIRHGYYVHISIRMTYYTLNPRVFNAKILLGRAKTYLKSAPRHIHTYTLHTTQYTVRAVLTNESGFTDD